MEEERMLHCVSCRAQDQHGSSKGSQKGSHKGDQQDKFQGGQKGGHKGEGGRLDLAMMPCSSPPTGATKGNGRGNCFVSLLSL
jgi:hypothetical protein